MAIIYEVIAIDECETCGGEGWIYDPHCTKCGYRLNETEMNDLAALAMTRPIRVSEDHLFCGCEYFYLKEESRCPDCGGMGGARRHVDLREALRELGMGG